jgi:hypothetical protein
MLRYDHYKLLGIARDASLAQIKRAYRERVKNCHPDVNPSPRASKVFRAVHEAYTVLSNARERMIYDDRLQFYRQKAAPQPAEQHDVRKYGHSRRKPIDHHEMPETPAGPVDRFIFVGLHVTGLLFALALLSGLLVGVMFHEWPLFALFFGIFGLAIIPDSLQGLRIRAGQTAH